jgi:sugar O-acyltransferase (sialic acid O-acetyltransferase NeuD family)
MGEVAIIGAGGHARTLINILELRAYQVKGVYDDNFKEEYRGEIIEGYPLLGGLEAIDPSEKVIIAKGNCQDLKKLSDQFQSQLLDDNLIHPSALVETKRIGTSNQISAMSYVSKSANIGASNLIYSQSTIEHEVELGDYNVVTVNVSLCGRVKIGNGCFFGAGSVVLPNLSICDEVTIGAGAVVTQDIKEAGTYVGMPAKKLNG